MKKVYQKIISDLELQNSMYQFNLKKITNDMTHLHKKIAFNNKKIKLLKEKIKLEEDEETLLPPLDTPFVDDWDLFY